jgi:murein DD-endopeptidase MepM/ murein hydrolase activator NlpD
MGVRVAVRTVAGVLAVAVLFGSAPSGARAAIADRITRQRSELEAIHARLQRKRGQLDFEALRERDYQRQLTETNASIATVDAKLGEVQQQIDTTLADEAHQRRLLASALVALGRQRDAYARRLVEMYEAPPVTLWASLIAARSFEQLAERWDDLRYVAAADRRAIRARDAVVHRVDALRIALDESVVRLQGEREQRAQARTQLGALAQERANLVAVAAQQRTSVAHEVAQLDEISAQEEAQLEQLVREQQAEVERERAAGRIAYVPTPRAGQMQWPLSGPITSPFGTRLNPFGGGNSEFHPGIDIGIAVGTPVAAAAAGRVLIAGWVSGYGEYVAVDHGGGISTGYGHLESIFVSVGQDVQAGQSLGLSGNTGRSTGPHLIFEVRRNGTPVDPTPYLR